MFDLLGLLKLISCFSLLLPFWRSSTYLNAEEYNITSVNFFFFFEFLLVLYPYWLSGTDGEIRVLFGHIKIFPSFFFQKIFSNQCLFNKLLLLQFSNSYSNLKLVFKFERSVANEGFKVSFFFILETSTSLQMKYMSRRNFKWTVWKERNWRCFEDKQSSLQEFKINRAVYRNLSGQFKMMFCVYFWCYRLFIGGTNCWNYVSL